MSGKTWTVVSRADFDLSEYTVLPFGRFNEATPFVADFLSNGANESDLIGFNISSVGKLRRAIIKLSNIELKYNVKKDKAGNSVKSKRTGNNVRIPVMDTDAFNRACKALSITVETHAKENADGKTEREFVSIKRA